MNGGPTTRTAQRRPLGLPRIAAAQPRLERQRRPLPGQEPPGGAAPAMLGLDMHPAPALVPGLAPFQTRRGRGGLAAGMQNRAARDMHQRMARGFEAHADVVILAVEEQRIVEAAHRAEGRHAEEHRRATDIIHAAIRKENAIIKPKVWMGSAM